MFKSTEDAVAALISESFGTLNESDLSIDYSVLVSDPRQIPDEHNEDIEKAILSLNTEALGRLGRRWASSKFASIW